MLAARYLHPVRLDADADETFLHKVFRVIGRFLEALERRYQRVLHVALNHRLWVVVGAVVLLTGSLALIPLIGTELMPVTDEGEVRVNVEMEVGTRLSLLDETFQPIEALVAREVPEAQSTVVTLGGSGGHASASNIGEMRVALKPLGERHRSSDDIAAVLRRKLTGIPGTTIRTRAGQGLFILRMAAGTSDQIAVEIRGYDIEKADALARRVKEIVDRVEGVTDTRISRDSGQPERLIVIDRSKAESMKVTVAQVAGMLQTVLGGTLAGYYRDSGDEYGIRVQVRDSEKQSMDDLLNLILTNSDGQPVVLRNVVSVQPRNGPVVIERKNQERIVSVTGNIRGRDMGAILADIRHGLEGVPVPRDFSIGFGGDYDEQQKAFRELGLGLILALVLVYMVMACQYESLKDPFVVMFSVPLAVVGVVVMLLLTNTTFNVQSYIGCIMLGGIVVNNAILLVDHTNLLRRRDGLGVREAIEEAGRRRLRPILMTALTTLLGLVPLALGAGEGGEAQAPLARAVIGGLLSSTVFTLVFIPVVYSLFEEKRRRTVGGKGLVVVLLLVSASGTAYAAPEPDAEPSVPPPAATTVPPALELRLGQSVLMALTNNRALAMQRLSPEIQRTFEDQERAVFDPRFSGRVTFERTPEVLLPASTNRLTDLTTGEVALESGLPSGTRVGVGLRTERNRVGGDPDVVGTTAELGVTQALLQGRPIEVNLASLRQARLATDISVYELRGFAEALVAEVETTYWEGVLARRRVQIYQESLSLADQQLEEISHRIKVGALAETELAAAQAETALRREGLINARSELALQSLHLLRLINPGALRGTGRDLMFSTIPAVPETPADQVAAHVQRALSARPDLKEARLKAESAGLELVKTRNGLLPKLDVFVTLGKTGYANSFGDSARNLESADPTLAAGVAFEYPFSNRSAEARHRRARYTQEQVREALTNMADLARVDIESACIERERTRAQVTATATTRRFQEEKVRSETAKFGVGRSTTLLVAQAQRDLIESQVSEVDAVIKHLQACIALYRLEGSLLDRRGIAVTDVPARFP
jgi:outer membrane protein TolC